MQATKVQILTPEEQPAPEVPEVCIWTGVSIDT
jgi:hypothetical protein